MGPCSGPDAMPMSRARRRGRASEARRRSTASRITLGHRLLPAACIAGQRRQLCLGEVDHRLSHRTPIITCLIYTSTPPHATRIENPEVAGAAMENHGSHTEGMRGDALMMDDRLRGEGRTGGFSRRTLLERAALLGAGAGALGRLLEITEVA